MATVAKVATFTRKDPANNLPRSVPVQAVLIVAKSFTENVIREIVEELGHWGVPVVRQVSPEFGGIRDLVIENVLLIPRGNKEIEVHADARIRDAKNAGLISVRLPDNTVNFSRIFRNAGITLVETGRLAKNLRSLVDDTSLLLPGPRRPEPPKSGPCVLPPGGAHRVVNIFGSEPVVPGLLAKVRAIPSVPSSPIYPLTTTKQDSVAKQDSSPPVAPSIEPTMRLCRNFPLAIRELRNLHGMTQLDLAKKLGLGQGGNGAISKDEAKNRVSHERYALYLEHFPGELTHQPRPWVSGERTPPANYKFTGEEEERGDDKHDVPPPAPVGAPPTATSSLAIVAAPVQPLGEAAPPGYTAVTLHVTVLLPPFESPGLDRMFTILTGLGYQVRFGTDNIEQGVIFVNGEAVAGPGPLHVITAEAVKKFESQIDLEFEKYSRAKAILALSRAPKTGN